MKLTNLKIRDLFTPDAKLTFLVGAGCSVDPPSCLPAGKKMINEIIEYTCAESEIKKIKELEQLRFEQLIEIVRDQLDKELKIIDYYGQCDKPNQQHFFLAEMIKNGHFVMTTNFDFLFEYALQAGVPKEEIKVIITKEDFKKFSDPQELYSNGFKALYKIHGSTMNILKPEGQRDTRSSLITTIQAFGSNKEGENVFQLEYFKKPLFENITKDRSLVVIGYSGSDDFDIVPTLKVLKNLKNLIWINFNSKIGDFEKIYEIKANSDENLDKTNKILVDIKRTGNVSQIFRVDANVTKLISRIIEFKPVFDTNNFSIDILNWLSNNIKKPSKLIKYEIALSIYSEFDRYKDAMRCGEEIIKILEREKNSIIKTKTLLKIGQINMDQECYSEALNNFENALQIDISTGKMNEMFKKLFNFTQELMEERRIQVPLENLVEPPRTDEQKEILHLKSICLDRIAKIHYFQANYEEAMKSHGLALQITNQLDDLSSKATIFNGIGDIYRVQKKYPEALKMFEEALKIDEQLGNLPGKATRLNNIGTIYRVTEDYLNALAKYEESLLINTELGNISGRAICLNNIAILLYAEGKYPEALKMCDDALQIAKQLDKTSIIASCFEKKGELYKLEGDYTKAFKLFEQGLQIGDLSIKALCLENIGDIYILQQKYNEAFESFELLLQIAEHLNNQDMKTSCLKHIKQLKLNSKLDYFQKQDVDKEELVMMAPKSISNFKKARELHLKCKNLLTNIKIDKLDYKSIKPVEERNQIKIDDQLKEIIKTRSALIPRFEADILKEIEKELNREFNLVEKIEWNTQMGFSTNDNRIIGIGLYRCNISELPMSLGRLNSLEILSLWENPLKQFPECISSLISLKKLYLYNSELMTLPESISNLEFLQELYLDYNFLTKLPKSIGSLKSLKILRVESNKLRSLPESIGNLSSLQEFNISNNLLEDDLPETICNLKSLQKLHINNSYLTKLPESIGKLSSLKELVLFDNQIKELPQSLSNLKLLETLNLENNELSTLPESIENLLSLKELFLYGNPWKIFPEALKILEQRGVWVSGKY